MKKAVVLLLVASLVATAWAQETTRTVWYLKPTEESLCPSGAPPTRCFTLSQVLRNETLAAAVFTSNTILAFLSGKHVLDITAFVTIRNVENLTFIGSPEMVLTPALLRAPASQIVCSSRFGLAFINITRLSLTNMTFTNCGANITEELATEAFSIQTQGVHFFGYEQKAALLLINIQTFQMVRCVVSSSYGYGLLGINVIGSDSIVTSSIFYGNNNYTTSTEKCIRAPNHTSNITACSGGNALFVFEDLLECPSRSLTYRFVVQNSVFAVGVNGYGGQLPDAFLARGGTGLGVVLAQSSYGVNVIIDTIASYGNSAILAANLYVAIYETVDNSTVSILNSDIQSGNGGLFQINIFEQVQSSSGGLHVDYNLPIDSTNSVFTNGQPRGPVCNDWRVKKYQEDIMRIVNCRFTNNIAILGAGAFMEIRTSAAAGHVARFRIESCTFSGGIGVSGTALYIAQQNSFYSSSSSSEITIRYVSVISNKYITPIRELTELYTSYQLNAVQLVKIDNVTLTDCLFYENEGSALTAFGSNIVMSGAMNFTRNSAIFGGGLDLQSSHVTFVPHTRVWFHDNYALFRGGAISVTERSDLTLPCFFQISDPSFLPDPNVSISIQGNFAEVAGSVLYGGSVDRCIVATPSSLFGNTSGEMFDYLVDIGLQGNGTSLISSDASKVCFCRDGEPVCSYRSIDILLPPSTTIFVPFVTVGLRNGTSPSSVYAITAPNTTLNQTQLVQNVGKTCTNLNFTVRTTLPKTSIVLRTGSLTVDGSFNISLEVLPCPEGFVTDNDGGCVCDTVPQLDDYSIECDIDTLTVRRRGNSWINSSYQGPNGSYDGVMVFLNCPYDYCSSSDMDLSLSEPNTQCNSNRTGILCGACKLGLSVTIGSTSRCEECSNYYVFLLILYFLAGILLVVVLFLLNLTIAQGTVGGIIFYANVVALNRPIFYPPGQNGPLTVIIEWLNLNIGIDTCYYDGMDGFAKIWIGFIYPFYIWIIVGVILVAGRSSASVSRLIGSKAVPVLAMMMYLSYNKLLRLVIFSLASTTLTNPDGSHHTVWSYDGNLDFFQGKHISLGLFALAVLFFFIVPYTLLLLLVPLPCIQARSTHKALSWINKFKPFFDAHQGPYKNKFRNWIGILLLVRVVLSIDSALNTGEHNSDQVLLVITIIVLILTWIAGEGMYKKWQHNVLEASFYINLEILAIATLFVRQVESRHQVIVHYMSGWIAVAELVGILVYHTFIQLLSLKSLSSHRDRIMKWMDSVGSEKKTDNKKKRVSSEKELVSSLHLHSSPSSVTTVSFNDLREPLLDEDFKR